MSPGRSPNAIRIGLIITEPIRQTGLASIFDGHPYLVPVMGDLKDLMEDLSLEFLLLDLNSGSDGPDILATVRKLRPDLRQIVIGPDGDDEVVMRSITAGARAYLDPSAGPATVRQAIEVVIGGSIWAPRRLLSKLIDRLLDSPPAPRVAPPPADVELHLTDREMQVLELILTASSNREIARRLGIGERTVKAHVGRLMRKTGSENRIELSVHALNHALMQQVNKRK